MDSLWDLDSFPPAGLLVTSRGHVIPMRNLLDKDSRVWVTRSPHTTTTQYWIAQSLDVCGGDGGGVPECGGEKSPSNVTYPYTKVVIEIENTGKTSVVIAKWLHKATCGSSVSCHHRRV